jgi:hypothetical protein
LRRLCWLRHLKIFNRDLIVEKYCCDCDHHSVGVIRGRPQHRATPTSIAVLLDPVPNGKLLVVQYISGYAAIAKDDIVDAVWVRAGGNTEPRLPVQLGSRPLNFNGPAGTVSVRNHQFGSPVTMYVTGGNQMTVIVDANNVTFIHATAIGQLI